MIILIFEAVAIYMLVLGVHSLRHKTGLGPFYALLGGITAIMAWTTDAGVQVKAGGITFLVGSTVFYTSLLLGVFVLYVFDGPRSTRIAIATVAGVSTLTPLVASVLHAQMSVSTQGLIASVPVPSLRINSASVLTTIADLIFLAVAWDFLGKTKLQKNTWLRTYLTLLGVMLLDVVLFNTGAFLGTANYLSILQGTMVTRILLSVFAFPFLYIYLSWQNQQEWVSIENRPILSIFKELEETRNELEVAKREIKRRKEAEEREELLHSLLRHDVRNKNQASIGYLKILEDYDLPEEARGYIKKTVNEVREGLDIIEKVRNLKKASKEKIKEVDVSQIIRRGIGKWRHQAEEKEIEIVLESSDEECMVMGGPLLYCVFSNIVENSIQHSGGSKIKISKKSENGELIYIIEDDGRGIPDKDKGKIYNKGYTTDPERGTGLGMFIVKMLLESYDGRIEVKDSELGGARFDIHLRKA